MKEGTMTDVLVDRRDGVLRITINRPVRLNALDTPMVEAISDALADADGVRVAVITGEGRAFSSGAAMAKDTVNPGILEAIDRLIHTITDSPFPVVAAVNGIAAGVGCSIVVACDVSIAKTTGYVLQAFVNIGLMPDGAATELLAASIGRTRAMRLMLSGEKLPAEQALEWGLLTQVVPEDEFDAAVEEAVGRFAAGPTRAYAKTKESVNAASLSTLGATLEREAAGQLELGVSADHEEGKAAFIEKRAANFTGR